MDVEDDSRRVRGRTLSTDYRLQTTVYRLSKEVKMATKKRPGGVLETARQVVSEVVDTAARVVGQAGETAAGLANSAMDTAAGAVASVSPTAGELVRPAPSTKRAVNEAARLNAQLARTQAEAAQDAGGALTDAAED